jgi:hypothetical protein
MKINKLLLEDIENDDVVVDPGSDSVAEIADEIQDTMGGEEVVSDEAATEVAGEIKDLGNVIEAEEALFLPPEAGEVDAIGTSNAVTALLDRALAFARKSKRRGRRSMGNVLISGLPGSGKTAIVEDWAKARGLNMVYINAKDNDLEAFINGFTVRDDENRKQVTKAYSNALDKLKDENSIIFLDELNRQTKDQIRGALLTLVNEHAIQGEGQGCKYYFDNLLFTVACINPHLRSDPGAAELFQAEKTRYLYTMKNADSDAQTTDDFLLKYYDKQIKRLNPKHPDYRETLEAFLRIQHLGRFIVNHRKFEYDGEGDLQELDMTKKNMFNQRMLYELLDECDGDVDMLRTGIAWANFLDDKTEMLNDILDEYRTPDFNYLCTQKGIDPNSGALAAKPQADPEEDETTASAKSDDDTIDFDAYGEDDDDLFSNSGMSGGSSFALSPTAVKDRIKAAGANW